MKKAGFTLVELLVTISIFVILTGVVLFSQSKFNSTIFLTNLAYDTALTIRQAQTFGINIKEFNDGIGTDRFLPYGVHFDLDSTKSFILFADKSYVDVNTKGDGIYDNTADISTCESNKGCVNRYNITKGNQIYQLCADGDCTKKTLDIVFIRPNPDAVIRGLNENRTTTFGPAGEATVKLIGLDGQIRQVKVMSTGLIEILH